MVKNLPTVERSTKIRFGKNVPDSDVQAENTIVFNASNTLVTTPNSGSIYMSPVRFRNDIEDPNIVLMMYNRETGELSESGESANALVGGQSLEATTERGNTTSNTVQFTNLDTSLVTSGNVGIANTQPLHSLSVGSNLYVSDTEANVLVVAGGVSIGGNLFVSGGVTTITSRNLMVDDGIIELGRNNMYEDSTSDLGIIMSRPTSNITVGFLESSEEVVLAYTQSSADNATITPLTSQDINVHVYGRLYTEANVGVLNTNPMHTLDVGSNLYVDEFASNILVVSGNTNVIGDLTVNNDTLYVDSVSDRVGIKTTNPQVELHVAGNAYVSSNLTVDGDLTINTNTLHVNTTTDKVGVKTTNPDADLHVVGNAYVSSNLTVDNDTLHVDAENNSVGVGTLNSDAKLHVGGNVYVSSNLTVDNDTFHVDAVNQKVGIETKNPDANLHVVGNVYVSDDFTVATNTLHVDAPMERVGIKTKTPHAELHIVGNVYVASDLTVDNDTFHVDTTNHSVGIETVNPNANLHVVGNAYVSSDLTVDTDTLHVDASGSKVGVKTKSPDAELHVVGNAYVSSDFTVDTDTLHVDASGSKVGVKTKSPDAELHIVGNAYVSSDFTVDTDTLHVDSTNDHVGINTKTPNAELHVVGNAYVSSDFTVDTNTLHVDAENDSVGVGTVNPKANLHVVGNAYVSSNLTVDTDTLHVDAVNKRVGIETVNPDANLHVVGNAYVSSNTTTDGTLTLNHPTTALITDLTANVEVKLDQLNSVTIDGLESDHILLYDGNDWINEFPLHTYIKIRNDAGVNIDAGDAVYVRGTHNANILNVGLAQSDSATTMPCIGISNQSLTSGQEGTAVAYGKALKVVTTGFIEGETVYVSNTVPGGLSNVKPFNNDLIQNVGVVTKIHHTNGAVFVTGIGRANDIPNAAIVTDETDINYVYVNDQNNDLKKIEPSNLLTQLQTLEQVSAAGNTTSNIMSFTNSTTSIVTASNAIVGGDISIAGLNVNKLPVVGTGNFLEDSLIGRSNGTIVISSDVEILGNLVVDGNSYTIESNSLVIADRILGIANNNTSHELDIGIVMEHPGKNVALIHHGEAQGGGDPHDHTFTIGYTQNTITDNHIFDDSNLITVEILGNLITQNNLTVSENIIVTGTSTLSDDLTVGGASNLFVDVSTSNVGINEGTPLRNLDVNGDMRVQDTTDTTSTSEGALVVLGGLGVASNIHSTNVYAASHVGVGTVTATTPVHVMATSAGGMYVNGDGNDARLTLEATGTTADPVTSFSVNGGESFSVGIDNSLNDTFNIANHASDVGTNARLTMTPAGITTITNTTNSSSKSTGALIVNGGLGVAGDIHATHANLEDVEADSVDVTDTTAATNKTTGALTVAGGLGVAGDIHATHANLEDVEADSVNITDTTTSTSVTTGALRVAGGISTQENLSVGGDVFITDTAAGSEAGPEFNLFRNRAGVDGHYLGQIKFKGKNDNNNEKNYAKITGKISDASNGTEDGLLEFATIKDGSQSIRARLTSTNFKLLNDAGIEVDGTADITNTTESTSTTTGALKVAGGVGVSKDVYVGERVYVTGGLITNTGQVTKKTYSFTGALDSGQTIANSTIKITFSTHVFYAKIIAHLIESDAEVSTLSMECGGGHRTGGTPLTITNGPVSVFGNESTNPWNIVVATTTTTVSLAPTTNMAAAGNYNIFIEYISTHASGAVTKITEGSTDVITFGY